MNALKSLPSILDSTRPAVSIAPPDHIMVSRNEWNRLHRELADLRRRVAETPTVHRPVFDRVEKVVALAAIAFGVRVSDITGPVRTADLTDIRMAIVLRLRREDWSSVAIAPGIGRTQAGVNFLNRRGLDRIRHDARLQRAAKLLEVACS